MAEFNYLNFIDGNWIPGSGSDFVKISPWSGLPVGLVKNTEPLDFVKSLPGLKKAQAEWVKVALPERLEILLKLSEVLATNQSKWSLLEANHQGLLQKDIEEFSFIQPRLWIKRLAEDFSKRNESEIRLLNPTGLIALILPWGLSLRQALEKLIPGLLAGNGFVIKASELSPCTGQILGELIEQLSIPKGLVQIFQGGGEDLSLVLAGHPSLSALSFSGPNSQAEPLIMAATSRWKKINVQASVKNSICILEEIGSAQQLLNYLKPALWSAGQTPWSAQRIFILESHQAAFDKYLEELVQGLRPSLNPQDNSSWTPMISLEALQSIKLKQQKVLLEQGQISAGGSTQEGLFLQPTFTKNLPNCSDLQQEDLLGPLFIVTAVKYQHEMAKWLNTTPYGHSAVIWGPEEKAIKVAQTLHVGQVFINHWRLPVSPLKAIKQSSFAEQDLRWDGPFFSDASEIRLPNL